MNICPHSWRRMTSEKDYGKFGPNYGEYHGFAEEICRICGTKRKSHPWQTREFALHLACEDAKREIAAGFAKLRHRLWLIDFRLSKPLDFVDRMMAQQPLSQAALSDMYNSLGNKFGGSSGAYNNQTNVTLQQLHQQQQACNNVFYRGYSEPPYSFYGSLGAQGLARVFW